jgi:hypothetical protein
MGAPHNRYMTHSEDAMEVTVIPAVSREEALKQWGLNPGHHWPELDRRHGVSLLEDAAGSTIVHEKQGADVGLTAHRGVLHPDEYVNPWLLGAMVEELLGFTLAEVHEALPAVAGRPTAARLELRARVDARLLEVAEGGGNMIELGKALGLPILPADETGGERCQPLERALARARAAQQELAA